jgi:hypothetical protein
MYRIGIDGRALGSQPTEIGRLVNESLTGLLQSDRNVEIFVFPETNRRSLRGE